MNMDMISKQQGTGAFGGGMPGRAGTQGAGSVTAPGRGAMPETSEKPGGSMALGGELITQLKEGVQSGDVDAGLPEEIERLVVAGAGAKELMDALRQAVEKGRISPLLLVKAEKLLGMGPGADEPVDRNQVVRGNRNQLTF